MDGGTHPMHADEMAQLILDRERREARLVVKAAEVDLKVVEPLEKLLDQVDGTDVERLELDLAEVSFADSSVLRLAFKAHEQVALEGGKVVIKASSAVNRVFSLTETARLFEIVVAD
jgi:anti-anti-sigma factor